VYWPNLDLQIFTPPVKLPKINIFQYWHERFHRDPGSQWIRIIFKELFRRQHHALTSK
jgi:hypothetical protein